MKKFLTISLVLAMNYLFAQCPDGYVTSQQNLVVNGDFSNGNEGFESNYGFSRKYSFRDANGLTVLNEGEYSVVSNPKYVHCYFEQCLQRNGKHGGMLVINGRGEVGAVVWKEAITVKSNTTYFFSCWIASALPQSPAILQFSINGVSLGDPILASSTSCEWKQFFTNWESGDNEQIVISIVNNNTARGGNDFILDDITFYECTTPNFENLLDMAKVGEVIELRNIFFETGKSELKNESFEQLDKLSNYLIKNPKVTIEIAGHTDNVGDDTSNLKLSEERAAAVSNYLKAKNIDPGRTRVIGYGETQPIDSNDTYEGRQINRRVEFKILSL